MASSKTSGVMSNFTALLLDLSALYLSITLSTKVNCGVGAASLRVGFDDLTGLYTFQESVIL